MKTITATLAVVAAMFLTGCTTEYRQIPAGYVGRVLTPTGWQNNVVTSGQVDLGMKNTDGSYNTLVLLEATSTTVKEQFLGEDATVDKTDHRIILKKGEPVAVDVYIRAMLPDNPQARDSIFALVTPQQDAKDERTSRITIQSIYERFALQKIRGGVRDILGPYEDYKAIYADYDNANKKIGAMVIKAFQETGVPLKLQDAQLSNVKPDPAIFRAENERAAASAQAAAIAMIGNAIKSNPEYLMFLKWESLKKIAEVGSQKGTNTVIVTDSRDSNGWAAAEYARGTKK